jgi:DNA mismatch repair protein MSH3
VEEIATNPSAASLTLSKLREVLRGLPDLDRGLVRIQVGTAKPVELVRVLQAFERVGNTFEVVRPEDEAAGAATPRQTVKSALLKRIVESLPMVKKDVAAFLARLNVVKAREGKKEEMFSDLPEQVEVSGGGLLKTVLPSLTSRVICTFNQDCGDCLAAVEAELHELLLECRKLLKKPGLNFAKVGEEEFL